MLSWPSWPGPFLQLAVLTAPGTEVPAAEGLSQPVAASRQVGRHPRVAGRPRPEVNPPLEEALGPEEPLRPVAPPALAVRLAVRPEEHPLEGARLLAEAPAVAREGPRAGRRAAAVAVVVVVVAAAAAAAVVSPLAPTAATVWPPGKPIAPYRSMACRETSSCRSLRGTAAAIPYPC
jgi:hypothetical protein